MSVMLIGNVVVFNSDNSTIRTNHEPTLFISYFWYQTGLIHAAYQDLGSYSENWRLDDSFVSLLIETLWRDVRFISCSMIVFNIQEKDIYCLDSEIVEM